MSSLLRNWSQVLVALVLSTGPCRAQEPETGEVGTIPDPVPAEPEAETAPSLSDWVQLYRHSERVSRAAFMSCDADADDRLSIFEAAKTLYGIDSIRDIEAFQIIDKNSNGYLEWPEFDQRFRQLTTHGSAMLIRPVRPFTAAREKQQTESPEEKNAKILFELLDQDGDGKVTSDEARRVVSEVGLHESMVQLFSGIDRDGSGDISPAELLPVAKMLPAGTPVFDREDSTSEGGLPKAFGSADENNDGAINPEELGRVLGRIDPGLVRWSTQIVKDADRSRNGSLGALEIRQAVQRGEQPPSIQKHGTVKEKAAPKKRRNTRG